MLLRWGIIGCGSVTEVKSGPGFQQARGSALVAVMRRNADLARDYAERRGVSKWYASADELIADPEVDIVSIATPPSSHCELALKVCAAGKPCLVEKPMALDFAECQRMVDAFEEAKLPLFVAYYRRALPRFLKVKELIQDGAIGEPRAVSLQMFQTMRAYDASNLPWRVIPSISGGGHFVDIGSHTLDLVDFLLAPIASVSGFARNNGSPYPAEDSVTLCFELENGIVGNGIWQFDTWRYQDGFVIQGTKGALQFATFEDRPVTLQTSSGTQEFTIPNPQAIQQPLIQTIVDQLGGGPPCPSTGVSASRTTRVMEEVLREYYSGKSC